MQTNRALEILSSTQKIEVVHGDTPVWIESVDAADHSAYVSTKDKGAWMVSVAELRETGEEETILP